MGRCFYIFILTLLISSCEKDWELEIPDSSDPGIHLYTRDFEEQRWRADFEVVDLDPKKDYPDFLGEMFRLSCENKRAGIQFSLRDTIYNLTGFAECPNDGIISCRFNRNIFIIRNDSLKNLGFNENGKVHFRELNKEIQKIASSPYRFLYDREILGPALIHFYIEDQYPIELTKEILREIIVQFEEVNSEMGSDFFKYHILFEGYSMMDIPPPPPPIGGGL